MSVGLLRILVQSQVISNEQAAGFQEALKHNKDIAPMLFEANIITPEGLAGLLAKLFNYPLLDLSYYPRNNVLTDVLSEEAMVQNRCLPIFRRGNKVFLAVADPTQIQTYQKIAFTAGVTFDLVVVRSDQLDSILEWQNQRSTSILKEMSLEQDIAASSQALYIDNEEAEDGPIPRLSLIHI